MPTRAIVLLALSFFVLHTSYSQSHHGECLPPTGASATLIITAPDDALLKDSVEIGVFSRSGVCSDVGVLKNGRVALAAWADDPLTPEIDGLLPGETFLLRVFSADSALHVVETQGTVRLHFNTKRKYFESKREFVAGGIYQITLTSSSGNAALSGSSRFDSTDTTRAAKAAGITGAAETKLSSSQSPATASAGGPTRVEAPGAFDELQLLPNYPNPTSSSTNVEFSVPDETDATLHLYDLLGRRVAEILSPSRVTPGKYRLHVDLSHLASGVYVLRLRTNDQVRDRTLHIVRDR